MVTPGDGDYVPDVSDEPTSAVNEPSKPWMSWTLLALNIAIWLAIGDKSTDFSFYTKRALLAAVYSATLLYWLNDKSDGQAASWAFLDRRIGEVMKIPQIKGQLRSMFDRLPNPLGLFAKAAGPLTAAPGATGALPAGMRPRRRRRT